MNETITKYLFSTYSNLFEPEDYRSSPEKSCMYWGFECGDGWASLIENMLKEVDEVVKRKSIKNFFFEQIKQKFGSLRAYYSVCDEEINVIVDKYEEISERTCEICGKEGKLNSNGWIECLCDEHRHI